MNKQNSTVRIKKSSLCFFTPTSWERRILTPISGLGIAEIFSINILFIISFRLPKMRLYIKKKVWNCNICFDMCSGNSKMKTKA